MRIIKVLSIIFFVNVEAIPSSEHPFAGESFTEEHIKEVANIYSQYRSIAEPCQNYINIDQYQEYSKRWMDLYLLNEKINKNDYTELKNKAWEKSFLPDEVKLLMQMLPFSPNYEATQACNEMVQGMTSFLRGVVINLEKKYAEEYGEIKREF
tara:strand:+ start:637 stop:1095 length:459 start_codon:yes stop_codon:yes gene_type:complete